MLWEGQILHVGVLALSSAIAAIGIFHYLPDKTEQHQQSLAIPWIVYGVLATRILHHIAITIIWRTELHCHQRSLSRLLRSKQRALRIAEWIDVGYFAVAGNGMVALAILDYQSCEILTSHQGIRVGLGLACTLVAIWAIGSALVYLGPKKLAGEDHFYPPILDPNNNSTLIRKGGAYSYVEHPIYYLGILIDWGAAILAASNICCLMAFTAHASALAFLYGTEIPDLRFMYDHQPVKELRGKEE